MLTLRKLFQRVLHGTLAASLLLSPLPAALADTGSLPAPQGVDGLRLEAPIEVDKIAPDLAGATGRREVVIRLAATPAGLQSGASSQRSQAAAVTAQQDAVIASVQAIDASATVLGRTRVVLNAVMMDVDSAYLDAIAQDVRVVAINGVGQYEIDLSETVPYIGATAAQPAGFYGQDVKVAVLDSGIDYTHAAFGGPGTAAAYQAAYGVSTGDARNTTRDGLFPTARVVDGYDFVGETWPSGPLAPDEDPIDCGPASIPAPCAGGHGTHVADIIGGAGGVAPQVDLYAVKVCSAVSTSCSGVAILQGIDWAADPNGDGDTSDRVDIINMSLGALYGQNYDNSAAIAVDNATAIGILTVASAGNSSDKAYVSGTPGGARTALSVAQTEVPSSQLQLLTLNSSAVSNVNIGAIFQPWSAPLVSVISAPVVYDTANTGTRQGCSNAAGASPWVGTPLAGKIVVVDRGTCSFSLKIANIAAAGGLAGIIALVDGSLPFSGGFGGGTPTVPGYMIRLVDGNAIKAQIPNGATLTLDPDNQSPLVGTVVGSSSRGPAMGQMFYGNNIMYGQIVKPEIGAPGASVSAVAGSGVGVAAFGGTSGAAPMVAGSAALLKNVNPFLSPQELKAVLMNNAETNIFNSPALFGGGLAPITRIGGGEIRIDRAVGFKAAAWEKDNGSGALSFGFHDVTGTTKLQRTVVVRNYSSQSITYHIASGFRFADDAANGAVSLSHPASLTVPGNSSRTFRVTLTINGALLRDWVMNLGATGGDASAVNSLTTFEYDGYVTLTSGSANTLNLPWHVLPRKAANVSGPTKVTAGAPATYKNTGAATANVDVFSWVGTNPFDTAAGFAGEGAPQITLKHVGVATFAGGGSCGPYILQFAVNAWRRSTTPEAPYQARLNLDVDRDGVYDFQVRNADATLNNLTDGRNFSWVVNLRTGAANAFFFTDHGSNSANMLLTICSSQLADATRPAALGGPIPIPALGQLINVRAASFDNYFTGVETSYIDGIVIAPAGEKYTGSLTIPAGGSAALTATPTGSTAATTDRGLLLMISGSANGAPEGQEAIAVTVNP